MLQSISNKFKTGAKGSLLQDALVYYEIEMFKNETLGNTFVMFRKDFSDLQFFVKKTSDGLELKFSSNNLSFLTWIKTQSADIEIMLKTYLLQKNLLLETQNVSILCLGK